MADWHPQVQRDTCLNHEDQRRAVMEQNARLLRMAKDQANHKPEDIALQQELGYFRIDILNAKVQSEISSRPPALSAPNLSLGTHAGQDYQLQLMLLEEQNKKRLLMARAARQHRKRGFSLHVLRNQHSEQEGKLRLLQTWARHTRSPDAAWTVEINRTERLVEELQSQIDEWLEEERRDLAINNES
ncbi:MAG: hypothetical protein Q9209_000118 [Squamulea sp. 1 TL-2023]